MIWAQQVKIMQYHIFCLPTLLMNLFPWVGWGRGGAGRGVGAPHANARVKWAEADTMKISSPQFLQSLARDLISSSPALGTIFLHYIISEIMETQWAAGTRSLAAGSVWSKDGVKAPIVIFIPLFHSNALLRWTVRLFTRVKNAVFAPNSTKCQNDTFLSCTKHVFTLGPVAGGRWGATISTSMYINIHNWFLHLKLGHLSVKIIIDGRFAV